MATTSVAAALKRLDAPPRASRRPPPGGPSARCLGAHAAGRGGARRRALGARARRAADRSAPAEDDPGVAYLLAEPGRLGRADAARVAAAAGLRGERDLLAASAPPARRPAHELRVRGRGPAPLAHRAAAGSRAGDLRHARRQGVLARLQPRALHPRGRRGLAHASGRVGPGRGSAVGEADRRRARGAAGAAGGPRRVDARRARRSRGASRSRWPRRRTSRCATSSSSRSSRASSSRPRRSRSRVSTAATG